MNVALRPGPRILALCAGLGGLELGVRIALPGSRTVCYVEREAFPAAALVARMEESTLGRAPVWDDLTTFDGFPWRGKVDLVAAGFPCQPWSTAGRREGVADERWIWPDIERVIREVQPGWVFLENTPGLVRGGLEPVLSGLAGLGFHAEWGLFSAGSVGAPHKRARVFLLAWQPVGPEPVPDPIRRALRNEPERGSGLTRQTDPRHPVAGNGDAEMGHPQGSPRAVDAGQREPGGSSADAGGRGPELADAELAGLEGHGNPSSLGGRVGEVRDEAGPARTGRTTLFPPGPDDLDLWARVLAETPEVEPSVCQLADRSTALLEYRTDRLRALGNGVVPLAAAVAFRALSARAGWELPLTSTVTDRVTGAGS